MVSAPPLSTSVPTGFEATVSTATAGQVRLIVTPILTAFEEWQIANFGSTSSPKNGSSSFKASGTLAPAGFTLTWPSAACLVFEIRRSTTLAGPWELLETQAPIPTHRNRAGSIESCFYHSPSE